jgi:hypothetical protein
VKNLLSELTLKNPKVAQLDKVLCKWFTAMHSEGNLVNGPRIIEKAKSFYEEMNITDMCTFSEGSNKKLPVRT